jgi:hypothetical protein
VVQSWHPVGQGAHLFAAAVERVAVGPNDARRRRDGDEDARASRGDPDPDDER